MTGPPTTPARTTVLALLERNLGVDAPTAEQRLVEELGADELDLCELALDLEAAFSIDIPEDDVARWRTVGDVQACVRRITGRSDV